MLVIAGVSFHQYLMSAGTGQVPASQLQHTTIRLEQAQASWRVERPVVRRPKFGGVVWEKFLVLRPKG
jgi:hypothetical protein